MEVSLENNSRIALQLGALDLRLTRKTHQTRTGCEREGGREREGEGEGAGEGE